MNLSELVLSQKLKILLVGSSGAGKTIFSCSAPGKTFVYDFDNKISSAASYYSHHKPEQLGSISYEQYSLNKAQSPYKKFIAKLTEHEKKAQEGKLEFDTIVLDSLTLYSEAMMAYVIESNPGTKRAFDKDQGYMVPAMQDYLVAGVYFKNDMNRILSLPCNVICTAHSTVNKDETTGEHKNAILLSGKIADHLPRVFSEVYWAFAKQIQAKAPGEEPKIQHVALTRSNGQFTCRTQIPTIPTWVPLDFPTIQKYMATVKQPQQQPKSHQAPLPQPPTQTA